MTNKIIYQLETVKKVQQKETSIHEYISQLVQQKEHFEIELEKTIGGDLHSYVEGKLFVINQVLENLTKILYPVEKIEL